MTSLPAHLMDRVPAVARVRAALTERISPTRVVEEVGPGWTEHVAAERIECALLATAPLPERLSHLAAEGYTTRAGRTRLLPDVLWSPDQNLVLDDGRSRLVSPDHGRERSDLVRWTPVRRRVTDSFDGTCTSLRSARHSHVRTVVEHTGLLHTLAFATTAAEPVRLLITEPLSPAEEFFLRPMLPPHVTLQPVDVGRPVATERYLWTTFLTRFGLAGVPTALVRDLRERFLPPRPSTHDRIVLVSRAQARKGRRIVDEAALSRRLAPFGVETIALEDLTIAEQVALFHDARLVIAPHGAGLVNLLFAHDADVIELFPDAQMWPHYALISAQVGLRHQYLLGRGRHRHDDIAVDVDDLVARVRAVLDAGD